MKIEEVSEITNHVENIDGEDVYILEKGMHKCIKQLKKRAQLEKDNCLFDMLNKDVEFICSHSNFAIAFRPVKWGNSRRWMPCLIYKHESGWRRVVHQNVNCLKCDWTGNVVSPTDPDLYLTMDNRFDILNKMYQLSFCKCPKCGGEISSKAIWIEDDDKQTDDFDFRNKC